VQLVILNNYFITIKDLLFCNKTSFTWTCSYSYNWHK